MKILHTEASCGWGGQEIRILEESRGLIDRGHAVSIGCPPHSRLAAEATRYAVPIVPLPIEFKTIAGFRALRRHLIANRYDVVNTHSSSDSWLTALACVSIDNPPALVRTRHISAPVTPNSINRWLYRRATRIVTTGECLRQELIKRLALDANRVVSVPTGIDVDRFIPADRLVAKEKLGLDPVPHIGIVSTLRSWKGHLFLLDAFARLGRADLRLLIVGDGPMREPIQEKIRTLGLESQVILAGQRTDPECWLQAMDIFCLPSYANEGVPQAVLQAMLCALPIITTPVGAILEAVKNEESALIVPAKDSEALAAAIIRLLGDHDLAKQLGQEARHVACTAYSRTHMLDRMENLFGEAIAR